MRIWWHNICRSPSTVSCLQRVIEVQIWIPSSLWHALTNYPQSRDYLTSMLKGALTSTLFGFLKCQRTLEYRVFIKRCWLQIFIASCITVTDIFVEFIVTNLTVFPLRSYINRKIPKIHLSFLLLSCNLTIKKTLIYSPHQLWGR